MLCNKTVVALLVILYVQYTQSVAIGELPNEQHDVSGVFQILSSKKIFIKQFNYDGGGPGAWFYFFPPGESVEYDGRGGTKIPLPRKHGRLDGRLMRRRYINVDLEVTLPDGFSTCDIGTFVIWCEPFGAIFTRIEIPREIFKNHASGPCEVKTNAVVTPAPAEFDNCIPFNEKIQVSWKVNYEQSAVKFRLCGCQSTEQSTNQYMGFGLSGSSSATQMFGADATIAWVDEKEGPQAVDYYLSAYTQCRAGEGACPDELDSSRTCTNDVVVDEGNVNDGIQCVSFYRRFTSDDSTCDQTINPDNPNQYIVWAIGGLGETAFKHFLNAKHNQDPIHLGRNPRDECEDVGLVCASCTPFKNKKIITRHDATFLVRIGPSGNERGYQGITGRAGWGISFHVNGTLIPELYVERGSTYTFLIQGGDNPSDLSKYHPFYITNSIGGGRLQNSQEERDAETVYAGFNDYGKPIAVGQLCQLSESLASETTRESCNTLEAYLNTLETPNDCASAQPGKLVWTPDDNTPDTVYYQCATHLNLGWKIFVLDKNQPYFKHRRRPIATHRNTNNNVGPQNKGIQDGSDQQMNYGIQDGSQQSNYGGQGGSYGDQQSNYGGQGGGDQRSNHGGSYGDQQSNYGGQGGGDQRSNHGGSYGDQQISQQSNYGGQGGSYGNQQSTYGGQGAGSYTSYDQRQQYHGNRNYYLSNGVWRGSNVPIHGSSSGAVGGLLLSSSLVLTIITVVLLVVANILMM